MIEKIKKLIILLAVITLFIPITYISAWTGTIGYVDTGDDGYDDEGDDDEDEYYTESLGEADVGNGKIKYECEYDYKIDTNYEITINGYDLDNNEIMRDSLKISDDNKIIAGTSIGLKISEQKKVGWEVTHIKVYEQRTQKTNLYNCLYTCSYSKEYNGIIGCENAALDCSANNKYGVSSCSSKDGCDLNQKWSGELTQTSDKIESTNQEKIKKCKEKAIKDAYEAANGYIYSSYKLKLANSNVKNSTDDEMEITGKTSRCIDKCSFSNPGINKMEDSLMIIYDYEPLKTCINVKNGDIRYIKDSGSCKTEEEIEVEKDSNHWHYFVPLKLNSKDIFEIQLQPASGANLNKGQCLYVLENYPETYTDLIVKRDDTNFENDWKRKRKEGSDYRETQRNGCRLTSKITIPITQQFYREIEEDGSIKFNGFNFYYKPININDPFPNGLPTNSLWKDWSENNNPDLTQSFASITYKTSINTSTIRNYTQSNPYTSWDNMNTTGVSKFIEEYSIINRENDQSIRASIYKLGCGPYNEDWGECKK